VNPGLQVLQKQRSHALISDRKVTTGQSFRLYYPGAIAAYPNFELTRHYGDSWAIAAPSNNYGATS